MESFSCFQSWSHAGRTVVIAIYTHRKKFVAAHTHGTWKFCCLSMMSALDSNVFFHRFAEALNFAVVYFILMPAAMITQVEDTCICLSLR